MKNTIFTMLFLFCLTSFPAASFAADVDSDVTVGERAEETMDSSTQNPERSSTFETAGAEGAFSKGCKRSPDGDFCALFREALKVRKSCCEQVSKDPLAIKNYSQSRLERILAPHPLTLFESCVIGSLAGIAYCE